MNRHPLPKFLLPIGKSGKPLLKFHLEMSHSAGIETMVMLHPSLFEFGQELIASWKLPNVRVFSVKSSTMTKTVKEAVRLSGSKESIFSVSMPDTFFRDLQSFDGSLLLDLRKQVPSLALWNMRADQAGKLGQVLVDSRSGLIQDMVDKDPECSYKHIWGMLAVSQQMLDDFDENDSHPGISLKANIELGVKVSTVFSNGDYLDCGTPLEYYRAFSTNLEVS